VHIERRLAPFSCPASPTAGRADGRDGSLNGDNLALKASAKPSAALLAKLKAHKAEIVALLRQEQSDCCHNQINGDPDRRECRVCGKGNGEKKETGGDHSMESS